MTPITTGMRLGRYEIRSKLGAGGMADVYLAHDTELGRLVALKLLPPETSDHAHARKRLIREARAAATLDHPHICSVHEVGESDGRLFIAMQYVEGQTLEARLRGRAMDLAELLPIAVQTVDALTEAHAHGILHRDIKPANIMLTTRGEAKVMDFGLAKPTSAEGARHGEAETESVLSTPGAIVGTVPYMAPEQVRGDELDRRSDLFSVGVMLYEMVAGRRPFDGSSGAAIASAILTSEPLPLARFAPDVPTELERIIAKLLRKDPEDRYQTAKDLLIDLRTLRDERTFQARLERSSPSTNRPPDRAVPASATEGVGPRDPRRSRLAWVIAGVLLLVGGGGWLLWRSANIRNATAQLPQIVAFADAKRYFEAYDLAVSVEPYLPGDATLAGLMPVISDTVSATTDPPGAQVYLKRFAPDESGVLPARQLVGTTPVTNLRIARGEYVLSIEKDGYAPIERTVSGVTIRQGTLSIQPPAVRLEEKLIVSGAMPARMVFVPGGNYRLAAWSRPTDRRVSIGDFFIDKYEVTNQEFKEFINAGGYVKREFWKHPFVTDGRSIVWDEAMKVFIDRTGLPGPRAWSNQSLPEGRADHPITDISWYEAEAYAQFRRKQLPTVYQWEKAARNGVVGAAGVVIMPWGVFYAGDLLAHRANFGGGTLPVTSSEFGMSPFGAFNMAGNVAEWTLNDSSEGYLATGGAWGDPTYAFAQYGGRPGFFSSSKLGFRLVQPGTDAADNQGSARIEIKQEIPVYSPTPVSRFNDLAATYRYEKTGLDARIEETTDFPEWKREKITFNGADGERAIAYLYLPNHVARPLQVLHHVPAGDVDGGFRSITSSMDDRMAPFVKSGRAAFGVVLKGYIERLRPEGNVVPARTTVEYVERIANRVIDLRRGLDYLETRPDLDATRIAFFAPSAGAQIGLILAAVETRYRAVALIGAGLPSYVIPYIAEANPINFTPHIRGPKLMVQGRYDEDTPLRNSAEPLFKLLAEPKRMFVYDGGHVPSNDVSIRATSGWLDEMLGPVKR